MDVQSLPPKRRPALRIKNKGGAPKGNRNALKHGGYTKEALAQRRAMRKDAQILCLRIRATIAQAMLLTMGQRPKITVARLETAERRNGET